VPAGIDPNWNVADALFFRPAVSSLRTTKTRQWASNRGDDEEWIDHLGAVTSMLVGLKRSEEGSLGRHPPEKPIPHVGQINGSP
jgi:hypothetical protein